MRVAVITPSSHFLQHRVRGTGFYMANLKDALEKYAPENSYFFCSQNNIPEKIDVIHYPYFEPFFLTLPFFKKGKTVVTVHDLTPLVFPKYFPKGMKGKLRWEIQKILLKNTDAVITDSNSSKKDIQRFTKIKDQKINVIHLAASEKFRKIPLQANSELSSSVMKVKYNLPDKFVLYVGDVTWNKNLPNLIEAVKKADLPLILVGKALIDDNFDRKNPWNRDLLKIQNLTKNNKKIIKLGFVSDEDLVMLYNMATVFAMPSLYEGFGLPILEAMSCGCPVISSKEGSISEVGQGAVFYVDPYNVLDIANGIKKVFVDKDLQEELAKKGLEQAKKFSWEKTAEQTADLYNRIA